MDSRDNSGSGRCKVGQEELVNLETILRLLALDLVLLESPNLRLLASDLVSE